MTLKPASSYHENQPGHFDVYDQLFPEPDNCQINGWSDTPPNVPGVVYYDSPNKLRGALDQMRAKAEKKGGVFDAVYVESQVQHEIQHGRAARLAGFSLGLYSLGTWESENSLDWQVAHAALKPTRVLTKLGLASIVAAPERLSSGDHQSLERLGYVGVDDVAERVIAHNAIARDSLLVPMGFSLFGR